MVLDSGYHPYLCTVHEHHGCTRTALPPFYYPFSTPLLPFYYPLLPFYYPFTPAHDVCMLLNLLLFLTCRTLFEETDSVDSAAVAPPSRTARGGKSAYKLNSVGARFRKQLQGLMGTLNQCQPHYIRSMLHPGPGSMVPPLCT